MEISKANGVYKYDRSNEKDLKPKIIFIDPRRINFSATIGLQIQISIGDRIAIFKLADEWYLAKTDEKNGYLVSYQGRNSLSFTASILCRQIYKSLGKNALLERTNYEYHQNKVWKLVKRIM